MGEELSLGVPLRLSDEGLLGSSFPVHYSLRSCHFFLLSSKAVWLCRDDPEKSSALSRMIRLGSGAIHINRELIILQP